MASSAKGGDDAANVRALGSSASTPEAYDRTPPHNLDAETSVLGSMLLSRDAIAEASELVGPADFYRGAHRTIYEAIRDLYQRGEPVDHVTVADELEHRGTLDDVGGSLAITDLASRVPTAANALYYARIVAEQALRRRLIDAGTHIVKLGYSATDDAEAAVDTAENLVYQVSQHGYSSEFVPMKDLLMASFERIESLHESDSSITGLPTGFIDFDDLTSGMQPANLVVIAARPAMGKSTLVTNIAANVSVEQRKPAVLFSLEMSQSELVDRLLASEAGVDTKRLRTGRLAEDDWPRLSQAMGRLAEAQLFIDDTPGINLMEIRAKCRRLKQKHGLELIILDYLQLMQPHRRAESRVQEVSELSRGLKILAKELEVPVIALSQLSRKPEDRNDRRPQLADLRESGCLTGDARVTLACGQTAPIQSLVGTQPEVVALDGWHMTTTSAARVWRTGRKFVYRLRLSSGRTIRATSNHKFRELDGWSPLDDIQPGTRIAVPRTYPDTPSDSWEDAYLVLLAHLIGDGCYAPGQPLHYTSESEANLRAVADAAMEAFGVEGTRVAQESWSHLYLSAGANRWRPNPLREWLRSLGIDGQRSGEKVIPQPVFGLPAGQIALFVRHLWSTDGCVWQRQTGAGPKAVIYYSTKSFALASQVQHLLTRLDIISRIKTVRKKGYGENYHLHVTGRTDQLRFAEAVGGHGKQEQGLREVAQTLKTVEANTNQDTIPIEVWKQVRARMKDAEISQRRMAELRGTAYGGTSHFRFAPSRELLRGYAEVLEDPELKALAAADVYWDTVVSIEPDGVEDVYDMGVPGARSFVANGIVVHNSIEQDSDIVAFIYRDEVYDQDTEAKGEAELIVAKHRNGPVGTIHLSFLGHHSRFANMARGAHGPSSV